MKIETVLGFLPVFIDEKPLDGSRNGYCKYIAYIAVEDINDRIVVEHEKVHAKENYINLLVASMVSGMSYIVSPYLAWPIIALYLYYLYTAYATEKGIYDREVKAYRKSAFEHAKSKNIHFNDACEYYAKIMVNSGLYGDYVKNMTVADVKKDLMIDD